MNDEDLAKLDNLLKWALSHSEREEYWRGYVRAILDVQIRLGIDE